VAAQAQRSGKNIIDMMAPAFNMFLGPLASLFLIGMFLRCRARTALVAAACSVAVSFLWSYWKILFKTDYQPTITLATAVPYLFGFVVAAVLGWLCEQPTEHAGLNYTWWAVMRGANPNARGGPPAGQGAK